MPSCSLITSTFIWTIPYVSKCIENKNWRKQLLQKGGLFDVTWGIKIGFSCFFFYAETIYNLIARVLFLFLMMEKNENGELLLLFFGYREGGVTLLLFSLCNDNSRKLLELNERPKN